MHHKGEATLGGYAPAGGIMDANSIKEELLHKPNDRSKEDGAEGIEKALKESETLSGLGFT